MIETIEHVLAQNERLLTHIELQALRQRLERAGNSQQALDAELADLHGAYNHNNAIITSAYLHIDRLEALLREHNIPVPDHPDFTQTLALSHSINHSTVYPSLLSLLRFAGQSLESAHREIALLQENRLLSDALNASKDQTIATQDIALTRTRNDKDELKALQSAAQPKLSLEAIRDLNNKTLPEENLAEARATFALCTELEEVVEQHIRQISLQKSTNAILRNGVRPLYDDPLFDTTKITLTDLAHAVWLCHTTGISEKTILNRIPEVRPES